MPTLSWGKRAVPLVLGGGMLATVVAAALAPNLGVVAAQTSCEYNTCSSGGSTPFPWWIVGVIVLIVAALIIAYLVFGRRPPPDNSRGPATWQPPSGAQTGGAAPADVAPSAPAGPSAAYIETPEDVGQVLPAVAGGAAAGGAAGAAAADEEPDIDSLMAELDKISGEILKKAPKGSSSGSSDAESDDTAGK